MSEAKTQALNPMMKHFFFSSFKGRKEFKNLQKIHGEIVRVAIIIETIDNAVLRIDFKNGVVEKVPFSQEEINGFLKTLNVKKSTIDESKNIFVLMDFTTKAIHVQQTKKDGQKFSITL